MGEGWEEAAAKLRDESLRVGMGRQLEESERSLEEHSCSARRGASLHSYWRVSWPTLPSSRLSRPFCLN